MSVRAHLIPTNLPNYHTFKPAPHGFDILHASLDDLHKYGIVHRPDPKTHPAAARLWRHVMSRVRRFVTPQLTVRTDIVHGPVRNLRSVSGASGVVHGGTNWSGVVVTDQAPYLQVWGTWVVPTARVPPGASGRHQCSAWVGLGGYGNNNGNNNLLQAGTEMDAGSHPYAWYEWFPAASIQVNLSVAAGQTIAVFVGAYGGGGGGPDYAYSLNGQLYSEGSVSMVNLETGDAMPLVVFPGPLVDYNGNPIIPQITGISGASAEWIVERPSNNQNGQLVLSELADYGELNFTNGGATAAVFPTQGIGPPVKTEQIAAASDSNVISLTMIADDGQTPLSEETETPALHCTFQQTAAGQ